MKEARSSRADLTIWTAAAILTLLHWDFWLWPDRSVVLGVVPIGLAYHVAYSLAAALLWALAARYAWPAELEEWAQTDESVGAERSA